MYYTYYIILCINTDRIISGHNTATAVSGMFIYVPLRETGESKDMATTVPLNATLAAA